MHPEKMTLRLPSILSLISLLLASCGDESGSEAERQVNSTSTCVLQQWRGPAGLGYTEQVNVLAGTCVQREDCSWQQCSDGSESGYAGASSYGDDYRWAGGASAAWKKITSASGCASISALGGHCSNTSPDDPPAMNSVTPVSRDGNWIKIHLPSQSAFAMDGANHVVRGFLISSGAATFDTFTNAGTYAVTARGSQLLKGYYLMHSSAAIESPLHYTDTPVLWWQNFTPTGISLHTAYWHDAFGEKPVSHGCVNLRGGENECTVQDPTSVLGSKITLRSCLASYCLRKDANGTTVGVWGKDLDAYPNCKACVTSRANCPAGSHSDEAEFLFRWSRIGTPIVVEGPTPNSDGSCCSPFNG
jgi:hypothetical protein